jgi:hypothetical protein
VRQFWKTGLALLVLVGLALYIWRYEWGREIPVDEAKETILAVDEEKAAEITIEPSEAETIRLVKEEDSWRVTAPFEAPADGTAVDSILTRLGKLEAEEVVVESTDDVAQYGLDAPSRTVSVRRRVWGLRPGGLGGLRPDAVLSADLYGRLVGREHLRQETLRPAGSRHPARQAR